MLPEWLMWLYGRNIVCINKTIMRLLESIVIILIAIGGMHLFAGNNLNAILSFIAALVIYLFVRKHKIKQ